jgi:hypothetical protein
MALDETLRLLEIRAPKRGLTLTARGARLSLR